MNKRNPKRDFTQVAFHVLQQSLGEEERRAPLTGRKASSSKGGKIGSKARNEALSSEERSEIARKAAMARWEKTVPTKSVGTAKVTSVKS